nr:MAG TPA: hypothetical protein [Caudoviricetes sp.]
MARACASVFPTPTTVTLLSVAMVSTNTSNLWRLKATPCTSFAVRTTPRHRRGVQTVALRLNGILHRFASTRNSARWVKLRQP